MLGRRVTSAKTLDYETILMYTLTHNKYRGTEKRTKQEEEEIKSE